MPHKKADNGKKIDGRKMDRRNIGLPSFCQGFFCQSQVRYKTRGVEACRQGGVAG
jgi:hypothetical protein